MCFNILKNEIFLFIICAKKLHHEYVGQSPKKKQKSRSQIDPFFYEVNKSNMADPA